MKKCIIFVMITLLTAAILTGCACEHIWKYADCQNPKTCENCGETEGETLEHTWQEADCDTPKTCKECDATEGAPLGHSWLAATCEKAKTCEVCGTTDGEAPGHSWQEATCDKPTVCEVCGLTEGDALGHTWQEATTEAPKTCSTCGATEGERIITDERFTTAASKEVFGTWSGTMLFDGEAEMGISVEGENLDFNAIFTYTFYNDGTVNAVCQMEEEGFFRVLKIITIEELYISLEAENLTREEADTLFFSVYGMTIEEYVDAALAGMSIEDFSSTLEGVYYVSDSHIYMGDSWSELTEDYIYTLEGDTMVMTDTYGDTLTLTKQP